MSLEQAIKESTLAYQENTQTLNKLIEILTAQPPFTTQKSANDEAPEAEIKVAVKADTSKAQKAEPTQKEESEEITREMVNTQFIALAKQNRQTAVALLTQFTVARASDLPEDQLSEFYQAVTEKLGE